MVGLELMYNVVFMSVCVCYMYVCKNTQVICTHVQCQHTYMKRYAPVHMYCISSMCGKYDLLIGTVNFPPL